MEFKNIFEGKWKQFSGLAKEKWGELTDDEIAQVDGNSEKLSGILQEKYGWTKEEAEKNISDFYESTKDKAGDIADKAGDIWNSIVGKVKETWSDFTDEDLAEINEDKDALLAKIEKKYNISKEEAKKKLGDMFN